MEILKKTDDEGILCYYSTSVFGLTLTACRQEGMGLRAQPCNSHLTFIFTVAAHTVNFHSALSADMQFYTS